MLFTRWYRKCAKYSQTGSITFFFENRTLVTNWYLALQALVFCVHKTRTAYFHPARAQVRCLQCLSKSCHFRSRNCLRTAHARQGGDSVWQMGEYVFLWNLPSLSHLNKLFCNLHDLWIEFGACLERRLPARRAAVALSELATRTHARVESINFSRI